MPFLLRVELPDVPGSLGRVASAIGEAGGDIAAIEIVEKGDGTAIDDVLLDTATGTMPDSIVSACTRLDGVQVLWVSRYAAAGGLVLDLEAVEDLTEHRSDAMSRLIDLLPPTFRADWAARVRRAENGRAERVYATRATPSSMPFTPVERAGPVDLDDVNVAVAAPVDEGELVIVGRRGGPEFLDSEVARIRHLVGLAQTIAAH